MLVCNVNDKLSSNSMKTITTLKKLMQMHKLERWHSVTLMIMHNTIMGASFLLKLIESTSRYINNPIAIFTLCVRNVLLYKCTIRLHVNLNDDERESGRACTRTHKVRARIKWFDVNLRCHWYFWDAHIICWKLKLQCKAMHDFDCIRAKWHLAQSVV